MIPVQAAIGGKIIARETIKGFKKDGSKKSLAAAESSLAELVQLVDNSRRVDNKLSQATTRKARKLLAKS